MLATQSQELRTKLRAIPAVPIVHVNRTVMILEPPSDATLRAKTLVRTRTPPAATNALVAHLSALPQAEEKALHPTAPEAEKLPSTSTPVDPPRKKKKGPKGPNPLSVKKKKPKADTSAPPNSSETKAMVGEKRRRDDDGADNPVSQTEGAASTHKRKRRRKHGAGAGPEAIEQT